MKDNPVVCLLCHSTSKQAALVGLFSLNIIFIFATTTRAHFSSVVLLPLGAPLGLGCGRPCGVFQPQVEEDIECPSVVILYCCCGAMSPLLGEWVVGHIHMNWIRMGMN